MRIVFLGLAELIVRLPVSPIIIIHPRSTGTFSHSTTIGGVVVNTSSLCHYLFKQTISICCACSVGAIGSLLLIGGHLKVLRNDTLQNEKRNKGSNKPPSPINSRPLHLS